MTDRKLARSFGDPALKEVVRHFGGADLEEPGGPQGALRCGGPGAW